VPEDVSVIGFDDIQNAAHLNPPLTTVRQPLLKMGEIAARALLDRIEKRNKSACEITIRPDLVVRKSTAPARILTGPSETNPVGPGADGDAIRPAAD